MSTLRPVKDISEYKRLKEALRDRFENERTGDQVLFRDQTKILQPLINTQQQTVNAIKEGQDTSATALTNALVPFTRELRTRNQQVDMLAQQPFYNQELPAISNVPKEFVHIDLDADLNETDRENLQDMSFELPSVVFDNKTIQETLEKIKTKNRIIGQMLGKKGPKVDAREKLQYESRRETLVTYRQKILGLQGAKQFVSTPKKTGKGLKTKIIDVIYYPSVGDLCTKLTELDAAKRAGNTGLENKINSILDELLRVKAIDKNEYDALYKKMFA
jgi:hypothetical protein